MASAHLSPLHLTAVVPVYNEELLVRTSLERLAAIRDDDRLSHLTVVIVDDGSQDGSWEEIEEFARAHADTPRLTVRPVRQAANAGKGAAVRAAQDLAAGEVTVIHDADLEYDPRDLLEIADVFRQEGADAVFGSRFLAGRYRRVLYFHHELGNRLLTLACNLITNLNLTDMETCYKAIRTDVFRTLPIESHRFTLEPELAIKLAKRGARIFEVPIRYAGRTYAEGKKITWKDGIAAVAAMIRFALSDRLYTEDPHGSHILVRMSRAWRYNAWMADALKPFVGQRVLEIGAGIGNLSRALLPRRLYWATDVNSEYLQRMEVTFGDRPYVKVGLCDVTRADTFPRPSGDFDTAICLNVVEHIADDVGAMRNVGAVLAPGGRALVLVPHVPWLFSSLDEVLGHCRRYSRALLAQRAREAGFEVERIVPFNRFGVLAWLINGKLLRRRHFGLGQVWLLNALTPLFRFLDLVLPLPPLSLIAVLRRPP